MPQHLIGQQQMLNMLLLVVVEVVAPMHLVHQEVVEVVVPVDIELPCQKVLVDHHHLPSQN